MANPSCVETGTERDARWRMLWLVCTAIYTKVAEAARKHTHVVPVKFAALHVLATVTTINFVVFTVLMTHSFAASYIAEWELETPVEMLQAYGKSTGALFKDAFKQATWISLCLWTLVSSDLARSSITALISILLLEISDALTVVSGRFLWYGTSTSFNGLVNLLGVEMLVLYATFVLRVVIAVFHDFAGCKRKLP